MAPLALGRHANLVYVYNQGLGSTPHPIAATLKRYDTMTRSETVIMTVQHASIEGAQVSADGQWVLFSTQVSDRSAIQLVRMDGQKLQTLYCAEPGEHIGALAWSPDQKYLAFQEGLRIYLLNVVTGENQLIGDYTPQSAFVARTWLDNTHLYMTSYGATETPPLNLFLLDVRRGNGFLVLSSSTLCGDFDRSIDGTRLFTSECKFAMPVTGGPSRIQVQPATGGRATTIYSTPSYAITALRVASPTTLLFLIHNTGVISVDTSHNGLWKVDTDGTGLTRLTSEAADETTAFTYTRSLTPTVSRDGGSYAVQVMKYASASPGPISLLIGSMSGGAPVAFATLTRNTGTIDTLDIVGWTTM
jgi:Tol biopolymer transport system component